MDHREVVGSEKVHCSGEDFRAAVLSGLCGEPIKPRDLSPQRAQRNTENVKIHNGPLELLSQAEFGVELCLGVVACPDVEGFRLYNPLFQGWTPILEFVGAEFEMDGLLRAGLKR
jgi:hypothetical protein